MKAGSLARDGARYDAGRGRGGLLHGRRAAAGGRGGGGRGVADVGRGGRGGAPHVGELAGGGPRRGGGRGLRGAAARALPPQAHPGAGDAGRRRRWGSRWAPCCARACRRSSGRCCRGSAREGAGAGVRAARRSSSRACRARAGARGSSSTSRRSSGAVEVVPDVGVDGKLLRRARAGCARAVARGAPTSRRSSRRCARSGPALGGGAAARGGRRQRAAGRAGDVVMRRRGAGAARARARLALAVAVAVASRCAVAVVLVAGAAFARPGGGESYGGAAAEEEAGEAAVGVGRRRAGRRQWPRRRPLRVHLLRPALAAQGRRHRRRHRSSPSSSRRARTKMKGWSSMRLAPAYTPACPCSAPPRAAARRHLEGLRTWDPDFSVVLFEDFLGALYANVHYALAGRIDRLSAYLAPDVLARLRTVRVAEVRTVIVGRHPRQRRARPRGGLAARRGRPSTSSRTSAAWQAPGDTERTFYLRERWTLARRRDARSRPARARAHPRLPRLRRAARRGGVGHVRALQARRVGRRLRLGRARGRRAAERRARPDAHHRGRRARQRPAHRRRSRRAGALGGLQRKDPSVTWEALQGRVGLVFAEFQAAWSGARPAAHAARTSPTALFDAQRYWIEAYRAQGLRNLTDDARIERLELARVGSDRWYDAVTVRLWATGKDYVVRDSDGDVVRGSKRRERPYSEYWTFIRGAGRVGPHAHAPRVPQLRRTARRRDGRRVPLLPRQRHHRGVRLGPQSHRAGRGLPGLIRI